MRTATLQRKTTETNIVLSVNLDGQGIYKINTPLPFLSHMLEQFAHHALIDIELTAEGDVDIDAHHTTEDIALTLGKAMRQALGNKAGIMRFAHAYYPMDECLTRAVVDLSGRPYFVMEGVFATERLGTLETQMIPHFFRSLSSSLRASLHLSILYGENDHHKSEGLFKACARALRLAMAINSQRKTIPSTKGSL